MPINSLSHCQILIALKDNVNTIKATLEQCSSTKHLQKAFTLDPVLQSVFKFCVSQVGLNRADIDMTASVAILWDLKTWLDSNVDVRSYRILVTPRTVCHLCGSLLQLRDTTGSPIHIITNLGVIQGRALVKRHARDKHSVGKQCPILQFQFDRCTSRTGFTSVAEFETFDSLPTILNGVRHIAIKSNWAIHVDACQTWCVNIVVRMPCSHTAAQDSYAMSMQSSPDQDGLRKLSSSSSNSTFAYFRRAFFIWQLLHLHHRRDCDTALTVRIGHVADRDKPSCGLEEVMQEYVHFLRSDVCQRSVHDCATCKHHNVEQGMNVRAAVMDGKVIPVQVCRQKHCTGAVESRLAAFCEKHEHLRNICRVERCNRRRRSTNVECCDLPEHVRLWERYLKSRDQKAYKANRARSAGIEKSTSVNDGRRLEDEEEERFKSGLTVTRFGPAYLPDVMVLVWSCGIVIAIRPIFSHERFMDVGLFLNDALSALSKDDRPDVCFYDNACRLGPFLKRADDSVSLAKKVILVVDRFHICGHSDGDELCQSTYAPNSVPCINDRGETLFASSMAETTNRWLSKLSGFLRDCSLLTFEFILLSLVDLRNDLLKKGQFERDTVRARILEKEQEDVDRLVEFFGSINLHEAPK